MKVLITGGNGQLGRTLAKNLKAWVHGVVLASTDADTLDITDTSQVSRAVKRFQPDVVVNCAAYTDVDGCESHEETAYRINAAGARNLAAAAFNVGAKMVQVSTDYVFEGNGDRPLREDDPINPQTVYGRSKALGEALVRAVNPRHFIVRTAWLFGEGHNFVRTMLRLAAEGSEIQVVDDQVGSPTSTEDLSHCIMGLIKTEQYGTYHGTCHGACSWYDFARAIFEMAGLSARLLPTTSGALDRPAKRPRYAVLDNFFLRIQGLDTFRPWQEALAEYLRDGLNGRGVSP